MSTFPTKADFIYWTLRQSSPAWATAFKMPVRCSIDDVVNAHADIRSDDRDPHFGRHNIMQTLRITRRHTPQKLREVLTNYASNGGGGFMAQYYKPIANRWLRRIATT